MKQLLTVLLVALLILCTGCSSENHSNENSVSDTSGYTESQQDKKTTSQNKKSNAESNPIATERSDDTTTKTEFSTENPSNNKKEPTQTVSDTKSETVNPSGETKLTEKNSEEETVNSFDSSVNSESDVQKATAADAKAVASKMVEYINGYRAEQGVSAAEVLPGLTKYAEYRSRQLVANFAHDTVDERAAATALKYGEYVDPTLYGMIGEPYYTANAREAIAKAGYIGTVNVIAEKLAALVYSSANHWNYVGNEKYSYIAIGVTYESGLWYCDIAVSIKNTDN